MLVRNGQLPSNDKGIVNLYILRNCLKIEMQLRYEMIFYCHVHQIYCKSEKKKLWFFYFFNDLIATN